MTQPPLPLPPRGPRVSARLRLALGYAVFLVAAGAVVLAGVYIVLRQVPNYPLTAANPRDRAYAPSRQEILETLVGVSGYLLAALAVVGVVGGWFLAGRVLRPLRRINDAATRIAATGALEHRIGLRGRNDEFRQLADSFDAMLGRLQDSFAAQERFAANASHELRTPLAVTSTLLEVARRDPAGQDYPRLLRRLTDTNERAIAVTEALLRLADANEVTAARDDTDLAGAASAALAECATEAEGAGVRAHADLRAAPVRGDAELLARLAVNLVQNAVRHNLPDGGALWVGTRHDRAAGTVTLRVENTGRPVPAEDVARLREPFLRGAGRVAAGPGRLPAPGGTRGHGLGLALVDRITRVHHGMLTLLPREGGGLVVTVVLPARPVTGATVP
ncbi:sensor histidine kinase [Streptomyces sp. NRRL F-2890]|uniref:sensor histidine kinase n=1 Tax=Streptomyces sp. NRRL F-2890 TaxID=1463845 RepID=UPI0004C6B20B|nr:HAMP domain-containing sensor histidine kinase [Streptomyces sp. NRRL F-2890]